MAHHVSLQPWVEAVGARDAFRLLAQQLPSGSLGLFDRDLRIVFADGTLLRAYTKPSSFEGKLVTDVLDPDVIAQVVPLYRAAVRGETGTANVSWRGHPYAVSAGPLRDEDGGIVGGISVNIDAANLSEVLGHAADSQQRHLQFFNGLRDPACIVDTERRIVDVNPAFVALTGYRRAEAIGRTADFLYVHRADYEQLCASLDGEALAPHTIEFACRDGATFIAEVTGSILSRDRDGAPTGYVNVIRDVTERQRAQAELEESQIAREQILAAMLQAEDDQRLRLATDLHDDAIQEMTASILSIDMLYAELRATGNEEQLVKAERARERLRGATERARRLMFELHPQMLEAKGLRAALERTSAQLAEDTGLTVLVDCPDTRFAHATESLAYRTVLEAIANIRRHANAEHVWITVTPATGSLHGTVRDDGVGFDAAAVRRRPTGHLHLGLAAMRERVRLAGGSISVESAPGAGTTVSFTVPDRELPPSPI
jgi:PAS domain S-box-containing protein